MWMVFISWLVISLVQYSITFNFDVHVFYIYQEIEKEKVDVIKINKYWCTNKFQPCDMTVSGGDKLVLLTLS